MRGSGAIIIAPAILTSSIQTLHAHYAEQVTPFNRALQTGAQGFFFGPTTPFGAAGINTQVEYQAQIAAYPTTSC